MRLLPHITETPGAPLDPRVRELSMVTLAVGPRYTRALDRMREREPDRALATVEAIGRLIDIAAAMSETCCADGSETSDDVVSAWLNVSRAMLAASADPLPS